MMKQNKSNRVAVRSKLTAVSSRPVNPGTIHSFTGLDHAMALHSVHVIFYYKEKLFSYFDLDPFRVCLSETLSLYPPVTGRIVRREVDGEWEVKCNDAGVRVVKATVATTLDEWLATADGAEERLLTAWDDMPHGDSSSWSPYRIQTMRRRRLLNNQQKRLLVGPKNQRWLQGQVWKPINGWLHCW
ncbi:protein ECERIFERUM 26-like isoform X1 [Rosa chinensis]|uniref:protein ECERIFERUM 26-like isoform X1 n=1 Tax=Rosa chinensis TaxID=74649 RepID=UPI001AD8AEAD|nr:protein ECERIFERUM 26-like isoform X1 [Rosa chinensis]